jgi:hypothetical protein
MAATAAISTGANKAARGAVNIAVYVIEKSACVEWQISYVADQASGQDKKRFTNDPDHKGSNGSAK